MYKLLYASRLADYGLVSQALHYCEAIGTALLSQEESDHPVLLVELIKVSFSKGSLQVFYLRCSEKAIVKQLRLCIPSLLNMLENWSPWLSLTTYACPGVISRVLTPHKEAGNGRRVVGSGAWKPGVCSARNLFLQLLFWDSKTARYGEPF